MPNKADFSKKSANVTHVLSSQIQVQMYASRIAMLVLDTMQSLSRVVGMSMALLTIDPPRMFTSTELICKPLSALPLHLAVRCLAVFPAYVLNTSAS